MAACPQPRATKPDGSSYLFKLERDFSYESGWQLAHPFYSRWLEISPSGTITVRALPNPCGDESPPRGHAPVSPSVLSGNIRLAMSGMAARPSGVCSTCG